MRPTGETDERKAQEWAETHDRLQKCSRQESSNSDVGDINVPISAHGLTRKKTLTAGLHKRNLRTTGKSPLVAESERSALFFFFPHCSLSFRHRSGLCTQVKTHNFTAVRELDRILRLTLKLRAAPTCCGPLHRATVIFDTLDVSFFQMHD